MHKVSRTLLLAGVLAFGTLTAACGDKVTVAPLPTGSTGITSITVTPSAASVQVGGVIQLAVSVVSDAATAKTVTWSSSNSAVATVDQTGKVTGVAAGSATILATSTVDASKAAASAITVTQVVAVPAAIAISAVNQNNVPANLNGVAGQLDVVLFVSGPSGLVNVIQNCTATGATSTTGDVIVAQQVFAGSQNQTPVTLSYNTAATGTITTTAPFTAVPNAAVNTPLYQNGACVLKANLTTAANAVLATATNVTPLVLANASFYRVTVATTGPNAISNTNQLNYQSGDVTFTINPINYVSNTPLGLISGNFAGRGFTNLAPTTGQTFTITFPSAVVAAGTTVPATSISQYTSGTAGDFLAITSSITTGGQNSFTSGPIAASFVRLDNSSPNGSTNAVIVPITNFLNASSSLSAGVTTPTDSLQTSGTGTDAVTSTVLYAVSSTAGLTGNANYGVAAGQGIGATQCSQTGWTNAATTPIPPSLPGVSTTYRARAFFTDKIGNVRCQDLVGSAGAVNANGFFGLDNQAPTLTKTGGPATNTVIVTGQTDAFAFADSISGFVLNRQMQYSLYRTFVVSTANCVPIIDGVNATQTGTGANGCTGTANSAPTVVLDGATTTQGYYNLTAKSVDQAGNFSTPLSFVYLLDGTAPIIQGISIPQNLVGGTSVTFTSTATDNVDLASTNFNITYSPATTNATLFYAGNNYGTKYTAANVTTSAAVTATVPFFVQQLQGSNGAAGCAPAAACGDPIALTAADSGEATAIAVRAVDAAVNVSAASTAAIPNINISSIKGFNSTGANTDYSFFNETSPVATLSNGAGALARSTTLAASAVLNSATAQSALVPFSQVCFYYQANAGDPTIPAGSYVQVGCVSAPGITDVAGVSRTWTYQIAGFDPPAALGTAGALNLYAVGIKAGGVGVLTPANTSTTLAP